jgi:putative oxidoreductase
MGITLRHIQEWSATHHPRWLVVLRVALGFCLFAKGIVFMSNSILLERLIAGSPISGGDSWLPILVTWANLLGGFFLVVGLMTRWIALLELPILAGAIIFINTQRAGFAAESELGLAVIVFLLLLFFLVEGGGPLSLDAYFQKNRGKGSQGTDLP